jgi:phosphotransferase system HPr (HPr) family protein
MAAKKSESRKLAPPAAAPTASGASAGFGAPAGRAEAAPLSCNVVIQNPDGLHVRPASVIAGLARKATARVTLVHAGRRVDARDATELLTLGAGPGAVVTLEVEGPDAVGILEKLAEVLTSATPPSRAE